MLSVNFTVQIQFIAVFVIYLGCIYNACFNLWKGALKPLAAAGFIATFAGLIYHYIGIGPNKETDDDEEDHHE